MWRGRIGPVLSIENVKESTECQRQSNCHDTSDKQYNYTQELRKGTSVMKVMIEIETEVPHRKELKPGTVLRP